jgi:hypothetical protein
MRIKHLLEELANEQEALGIVIADGGRGDANVTRFSAFVWGPVPEDAEVPEEAAGWRPRRRKPPNAGGAPARRPCKAPLRGPEGP